MEVICIKVVGKFTFLLVKELDRSLRSTLLASWTEVGPFMSSWDVSEDTDTASVISLLRQDPSENLDEGSRRQLLLRLSASILSLDAQIDTKTDAFSREAICNELEKKHLRLENISEQADICTPQM